MNIQPLGDRILVKPLEAAQKTKGGIFIPQTAQEKTQEAKVIAVGDSEDIKVKKGDSIIYEKFSGTNIKIAEEEHIIIKSDDVLAKFN